MHVRFYVRVCVYACVARQPHMCTYLDTIYLCVYYVFFCCVILFFFFFFFSFIIGILKHVDKLLLMVIQCVDTNIKHKNGRMNLVILLGEKKGQNFNASQWEDFFIFIFIFFYLFSSRCG